MDEDDDLAELRRRRMGQLQDQARAEVERAEQRAAVEQQKQLILRAILTTEARERLTRIAMARPDIAVAVENQLIALAESGRVRGQIDDATFRALLERIIPKKRDIKIERK